MVKSELVDMVHDNVVHTGKARVSKRDVEAIVGEVFDVIQGTLTHGGDVRIAGFGVFETRQRAARMGRDPRNQEAVEIPATTVPVFRAGKKLKELVGA